MKDNEENGGYSARRDASVWKTPRPGAERRTMVRRRRRKKEFALFGVTLLLTVVVGITLVLAGWTVLGKKTGLEAVVVTAEALLPHGTGNGAAGVSGAPDAQGMYNEQNVQGDNAASGKYTSLLADPAQMAAQNMIPLTPAAENEIRLLFAGDILFDDSYSIMVKMKSRSGGGSLVEAGFDAAILQQMRGADIFMVNNEFTYTTRGTPTEGKAFTFRARPEHAALLSEMGADIVSIANNHVYDYGEISLLDTLDTLTAAGMPYVGAGRNLAEAVRPVCFVTENVKITFLSATQIERMDNPDTKGATETSPGVFRCRNVDLLLSEVEKAKAVSDFVVVYVHWGTESTTELDWAQKEQAPLIAQAGADLIIGDHPHVLQGIEWIGDTPVIYSVGNFLFNSKTQDTCLVEVTLDAQTGKLKTFRFIPAIQKDCRTSLLDGTEKARVISHMQNLSPGVAIDAEGYVTKTP